MRDKPRIIMIAPPHVSVHEICEFIKEETGITIITFNDIGVEDDEIPSAILVDKLIKYIEKYDIVKKGWIMYDFPRSFIETKMFQKHGIYPTHAFEICSSPDLYSANDAWFRNIKEWPIEKFREAMVEYKRKAFGLHKALQTCYKKVPVKSRTEKQVARACVDYSRIPVFKGNPMLPRIVLIGTRGSRRRTTAKRLEQKYNIVHVDLKELIIQTKGMENETGEQLRALEVRNMPIYSRIVIAMLQKRLMQWDCIHKGWVLTNFPRDVADFKVLDNLDTPPNKVIFLSIQTSTAYQRLKNRKVNIFDGEMKNIDEIISTGDNIQEYFTHPRDLDANVIPEQEDFAKNIKEMLKYCGDNCNIVNADGTDNQLFDRVSSIVTQPCVVAPPRKVVTEAPIDHNDFVLREQSHSTIYPNIVYENERQHSFESKGLEFMPGDCAD
nr:adenylate kinase 8 isoform X2 [Halyomorpha halys]